VRHGAAVMIDQRELTGERLAQEVLSLAEQASRRAQYAKAARTLARPDAAAAIVDRIVDLART
jgi:UDP-N-acetylglucosamine--N-acetylmuramyl-(pentapeptide) pyrophosphoryl-undecaprenol N-acetylglucosamine transferase